MKTLIRLVYKTNDNIDDLIGKIMQILNINSRHLGYFIKKTIIDGVEQFRDDQETTLLTTNYLSTGDMAKTWYETLVASDSLRDRDGSILDFKTFLASPIMLWKFLRYNINY